MDNISKLLDIKFEVSMKFWFIFLFVFFKLFNSFDDISFIELLKVSKIVSKFKLFMLKVPKVVKSPVTNKSPLNIFELFIKLPSVFFVSNIRLLDSSILIWVFKPLLLFNIIFDTFKFI